VEVLGEAGDGAGAISLAQSLRPDVILMDVRMPGMDGISTLRTIRALAPESAVVILSLYDDAKTRAGAEEAGAAAFVAKHQVEETLLVALRRAASRRSEYG
jgi:DNA-binding NarL/FixJ family response regulator